MRRRAVPLLFVASSIGHARVAHQRSMAPLTSACGRLMQEQGPGKQDCGEGRACVSIEREACAETAAPAWSPELRGNQAPP